MDLHTHVHSIIHDSGEVEAATVCPSTDDERRWYPCNGRERTQAAVQTGFEDMMVSEISQTQKGFTHMRSRE